MCDNLILGRYYLCDDCWEELLAYKDKLPPRMTQVEIKEAFEKFLGTEPGHHREVDTAEEFENVLQARKTTDRYDEY